MKSTNDDSTTPLTSRERVLRTLNHENPDRVPIDLGSTGDTSIVKEAYDNLRSYLNLPVREADFLSIVLRSVRIDEDVQNILDTDIRGIYPGQVGELRWLSEKEYRDGWGITRIKPDGSYYYDQREYPLSGTINENDIYNYHHWPDPEDEKITRNLMKQVRYYRENTDKALLVTLPACFIHRTQFLRGYEDWFIDCATDPTLIETLFDAVLDINTRISERILNIVGNEVDIVMTSDDLGTQQGLQVSPEFFRRSIKPRLKKYFDLVHGLSPDSKLMFHSCGSIEPLLEDFIQIGVDIINPVQVSAVKMDTVELKQKYGSRISFWGAIDTQHVLSEGTLEEVEKEVEKRIIELAADGGFILGAVHNIQPDVQPENIVTMFEHAKDFSVDWYLSSSSKVKF